MLGKMKFFSLISRDRTFFTISFIVLVFITLIFDAKLMNMSLFLKYPQDKWSDIWNINQSMAPHGHHVLFRIVSSIIIPNAPYMLYFILIPVYVAVLIFNLSKSGVPLFLAGILILAQFNNGIFWYAGIASNDDILVNMSAAIILLIVYNFGSGARIMTCILIFIGMIGHERLMFVMPFICMVYFFKEGFNKNTIINAVFFFILLPIMFFSIFNELYYYYYPQVNPYYRLELVSQVRRMLRIGGDSNVEGSIMEGAWHSFILHPMQVTLWGPALAFPVVLYVVGRWMSDTRLAWSGVVLLVCVNVQLLVAEDVHRMTTFYQLGLLLISLCVARLPFRRAVMGWIYISICCGWFFRDNIFNILHRLV